VLWRIAPLTVVLAALAAGVVWRIWSHWRRYGTLGVFLFRSRVAAHHVRDALLVAFFAVVTLQAAAVALAPASATAVVGTLPHLEASVWRTLGVVLAIGAAIVLVASQRQLGSSWRIGVDEATRPGLCTDGLYRFCRNPIYVSWWIWAVGYLLLLPTWVSLLALCELTLTFYWYVEEEEKYLARVYGKAYFTYSRRVGRFVPRISRHR
jgi:protein-S-isoprenylcysteine O-methyltransferase Ste14